MIKEYKDKRKGDYNMNEITKDMFISEILEIDYGLFPVLMESGMHCIGCPSSQMESLEDACYVHGIDPDDMVAELNDYLSSLV